MESTDGNVFVEDAEEESKQNRQSLCGKSWQLYRVSPLYGYTEACCQDWAKDLQKELKHEFALRRNLPIIINEDQDQEEEVQIEADKIKAEVSSIRGLRGSDADPHAVKIEVSMNKTKLLHAFLLGMNAKEQESAKFANLPVLLINAAKEFIDVLTDNIEKNFDCIVAKVYLKEDELKWASAMWSSFEAEEESQEKVILKYKYQSEDKSMSGLFELEMKAGQMCQLWLSVHDEKESFATQQEILTFHEALVKQVKLSMGVNLNAMSLTSITLPSVKMDCGSTVRMFKSEHVRTILRFLTSICDISLESFAPRIGIPAQNFTTA